jgi:hypothetical protein
MNSLFQIPAACSKISTLSDGTVRIQFDCQETAPEEMTKIFAIKTQQGWLLFNSIPIQETDLPKELPEFDGQKSTSERLYNTLYILHQKMGGKNSEFDIWRKKQMEIIIERIKGQIEKFT